MNDETNMIENRRPFRPRLFPLLFAAAAVVAGSLGLVAPVALAIVLRIAIPTTVALIEATNAPPPPPAPGSPAPSGPPPHIAALVKRQRQFGQIITLLLVLIIILMVTKPHLT